MSALAQDGLAMLQAMLQPLRLPRLRQRSLQPWPERPDLRMSTLAMAPLQLGTMVCCLRSCPCEGCMGNRSPRMWMASADLHRAVGHVRHRTWSYSTILIAPWTNPNTKTLSDPSPPHRLRVPSSLCALEGSHLQDSLVYTASASLHPQAARSEMGPIERSHPRDAPPSRTRAETCS